MTDIQLQELEVTNFRSIKGLVHAPLDAKVVLIHGENGSGKTSLLAAIQDGADQSRRVAQKSRSEL